VIGAVEIALQGMEEGEGRDKASATTFLGPGRWEKFVVNSERKER
jgi:hypothetical protein